jgi:ABC-type Fe3+-hydroxamate transport system substrate-binding protein
MRIVCLVPSLTELLHYLGLENEVVGITKFCVHPVEWFRTKTRIGGTKNCKLDIIESLEPTLIIANKEENTKEDVEYLQKKFTVYVSDIKTIQDALDAILQIGQLVNRVNEAATLAEKISMDFAFLQQEKWGLKNCVYLIWREPYMAAGSDTFINSILALGGFKNKVLASRYPTITEKELQKINPAYVLLSSEPYPFEVKHIQELQNILPDSKIQLVDGEIFSWYGSRMLNIKDYLIQLNTL